MKLINLLLENEEDGMKKVQILTDLSIQTDNITSVLDALDNPDNYGIYSQNLSDQSAIDKIFGARNPATKTKQAQTEWDSMTSDEKLNKIDQIKNMVIKTRDGEKELGKQTWNNTLKLLEKYKPYQEWVKENGDNPEKYLSTLDGETAGSAKGLKLFGSRAETYFPQKTPESMKKYGGKLIPGVHYFEKGDKIVFPQANSPFKSKPYLQKALTTIMDKAGLDPDVDYKIVDVEVGDDLGRTAEKPKKEEVPPLTATLNDLKQVEKLRKAYQKEIGEVPSAEYKTEKVDGKYKLIVTGLTKQQRQKLFTTKALFTQNLKEEEEFSRTMKIRAGIIK